MSYLLDMGCIQFLQCCLAAAELRLCITMLMHCRLKLASQLLCKILACAQLLCGSLLLLSVLLLRRQHLLLSSLIGCLQSKVMLL